MSTTTIVRPGRELDELLAHDAELRSLVEADELPPCEVWRRDFSFRLRSGNNYCGKPGQWIFYVKFNCNCGKPRRPIIVCQMHKDLYDQGDPYICSTCSRKVTIVMIDPMR